MRIMDTIFLIVRFFFNLISSNVKAKWPFLTCTGCHIVSSFLSTYNKKGSFEHTWHLCISLQGFSQTYILDCTVTPGTTADK